jgi:hypothetical protein
VSNYRVNAPIQAEEILPRNNINDTPLGRLFGNILSPISNLITRTSTTTQIAELTVTSAVYASCIPVAQFSTVVAADPAAVPPVAATLATTACARRRRDVSDLLAEVDIHPALPLP